MFKLLLYSTNQVQPDEVFEGTARQLYYTACHILRRKRFYGFEIPYMWASNAQLHCAIAYKRMALYFGY